jgi:cytochrome P450
MSAQNPDPETNEVSFFDPEFAACPQAVYRRTISQCPVTRMAFTGSPVVTRYEDVMWCLRHPEIFSSDMSEQMALGTKRPMIPQQIDPPAQTRFRKILDPLFSRKRMLELEPDVRRDANVLIDALIDEGKCEFNSSFAIPLPCNVFLHLMGLPAEDLALFLRLKDGIIRPHTLADSVDLEIVTKVRADAGAEIYAYFEDLIAKRRTQPTDDLMTYFLTAEIDEAPLTDEEIQDICFLFLIAGLDTVTATLGCNMAYLAANPEQRRLLLDDPGKLDGAIEELLRWETPVTAVPRLATQDVTLGGMEIKEGEMVTLMLGAANVDDEEFGNANEVDLERERNRHLAFGGGAHRCLGSHLARMELSVAMEEWHRRIPDYGIEPGETPTYSAGIREVQYLPLVWPARS